MNKYTINTENVSPLKSLICPKCNNKTLEVIQPDQIVCKNCRLLFFATTITDCEMIEWFT